LELQQEHHVDFIQPLAAAPAEASLELQQERQVESWQPLAATAVLLSLAWAPDASAATVCLAVPDWVADWRGTLFHSPVVAVGVAGLALIWFPKLIRVRDAAAAGANWVRGEPVSVALRVAAQHPTQPCSHHHLPRP
jgi:hypothetical protein